MPRKAVRKNASRRDNGWILNVEAKCTLAEGFTRFEEHWDKNSGLDDKYWLVILQDVKSVWIGDQSALTVKVLKKKVPELRRSAENSPWRKIFEQRNGRDLYRRFCLSGKKYRKERARASQEAVRTGSSQVFPDSGQHFAPYPAIPEVTGHPNASMSAPFNYQSDIAPAPQNLAALANHNGFHPGYSSYSTYKPNGNVANPNSSALLPSFHPQQQANSASSHFRGFYHAHVQTTGLNYGGGGYGGVIPGTGVHVSGGLSGQDYNRDVGTEGGYGGVLYGELDNVGRAGPPFTGPTPSGPGIGGFGYGGDTFHTGTGAQPHFSSGMPPFAARAHS